MTRFVLVNFYPHTGGTFDLNLELQLVQEAIERHRQKIELADKYNLELEDSGLALPELITDERMLKDLLKGRFNIVVINEKEGQIKI